MDKGTRNGVLVVIVILVVLLGVFYLPKGTSSKYANLEAFAQCLTDKGVKMYGAYWCSHCKSQKALFGSAFSKVDYIECTEEAKVCEAANIKSYPTWIFPDTTVGTTTIQGRTILGETTLENLADQSSCTLETK